MSAEVWNELIKAIITVLVILITSVLIPYIKGRIGQDKLDILSQYAEYGVRCAEQIYTKEQWKEKKAYVYDYVIGKANDLGIGLTEADIDLIVEAVVNAVKHGGE